MQAAVSFHNLRHGAERAEAQFNAFRTHLAVNEECSQPRTFQRSQPCGQALRQLRRLLCRSVQLLLSEGEYGHFRNDEADHG